MDANLSGLKYFSAHVNHLHFIDIQVEVSAPSSFRRVTFRGELGAV
jgi:hypothetical protein